MKTNKHTLDDVIRMSGHLLEHHHCTGRLSVDRDGHTTGPKSPDASRFCFLGALEACSHKLGLRNPWLHAEMYTHVTTKLGLCVDFNGPDWDELGPCEKLEFARRMQAVK